MKNFNDLIFKPSFRGKGATLNFDNGYGVSVITGGYGNESRPYEVAILKDGFLCYDTYITNDVIGWNKETQVSEIMKKVQEL